MIRAGCGGTDPGRSAVAARRARAGATLAAAAALVLACVPRPAIVAPADGSQVPGDAALLRVEVELGAPLGPAGRVHLRLLRGLDRPPGEVVDLDALVVVEATRARATLAPLAGPSGLLGEGRHVLFASVDADGDGRAEAVASSTFSFVPGLDASLADRCDLLDPQHCLYPFPSNFFTRPDPGTDTGLRIAFPREGMPRNFQGRPIEPEEWNRNDGFSPGSAIQTVIPGLDFEASRIPPLWEIARSLDADSPVVLLDAETGERVPFFAELDVDAPPGPRQALFVRPARNLRDGRRYAVAFRHLVDTSGTGIPAGVGFRVYRDRLRTFLPAVEARRPAMERLFADLERAGIHREDLFLAFDFTVISTRNLSERMLTMRDDAFARLGDRAPSFRVTRVEERSRDGIPVRRIDGTFEVPLYLTEHGRTEVTRLTRGPDGLPVQATVDPCAGGDPGCDLPPEPEFFTADFRCTVPGTATPENPARPALYGHGLLGSQDEVGASHVEAFAVRHNLIFCGTRWIGMGEEDQLTAARILADMSGFPSLADRLHQAILNFLFLGRLMIHPDGLRTDPAFGDVFACTWPLAPGEPRCLFYDGNSQGGIAGGGLAGYAQDFDRVVLGVTGMNYSTLLRRSVDFDVFRLFLGYTDPLDINLAISLAQMLWDRTETNGQANHLTRDPYPGTPAKKVLIHVAWGDLQVAQITADNLARTIGASVRWPAFDPSRFVGEESPAAPGTTILEPRPWRDRSPYFGIPRLDARDGRPVDASVLVVWDSGNLEPPPGNRPPPRTANPELQPCPLFYDSDPHECPRRAPESLEQKSAFLAPDGAFVDTCGERSCAARFR